MKSISSEFLNQILRTGKLSVYGVVTPKRYKLKPTVLTSDAKIPAVLDGIKFDSDYPHDWMLWEYSSETPSVVIQPSGIFMLPGGPHTDDIVTVTLHLGFFPVIERYSVVSDGTIDMRVVTASSSAGLATADPSDWFDPDDLIDYPLSPWVRISLRLDGASSSVTSFNLKFANQIYSHHVLNWGRLNKQLQDNGIASASFSPTLQARRWGAEKLSVLGQDIGVVLAANSRRARDYIALWQGQISGESSNSIDGDMAREYFTQHIPRYKTSSGKYWPTPFGDFTDTTRIIVDDGKTANYDLGARLIAYRTSAGAAFKSIDITITKTSEGFSASSPTEDLTYNGGQISNDAGVICTVSISQSGAVINGDYVQVYCRKGGQCPGVWLYDTETQSVYALSQWPVGEINSIWVGDVEYPVGKYSTSKNANAAGRSQVAYATLDKIGRASESITYGGGESSTPGFTVTNDASAYSTITGTPTRAGAIYIEVNAPSGEGSQTWAFRIDSETSYSAHTPVVVGIPTVIGLGLSITWNSKPPVPPGAPTIPSYYSIHITAAAATVGDMEWRDSERILHDSKVGDFRFRVKTSYTDSFVLAAEYRAEPTESWASAGDDIQVYGTSTATFKNLQFAFPGGNNRTVDEYWTFTVSRFSGDITWAGTGIYGRTTLAEIIREIVNWTPAKETFLNRDIMQFASFARLPQYEICGQLPDSVRTVSDMAKELIQNIADVDLTEGAMRAVAQEIAPGTDETLISLHVRDCRKIGEYVGSGLSGIQNDIELRSGDGFHSGGPEIAIRKSDDTSIKLWERINGHGVTWGESVKYPYATRTDATEICENRLDYKKTVKRHYRLYPKSPLYALLSLGEWIMVTDNWIENHTYQQLGLNKQPMRIDGVEIDLDSLEVTLLASVVGDLERPSDQQLDGGSGMSIGFPEDDSGSLIWGETPWGEGSWG